MARPKRDIVRTNLTIERDLMAEIQLYLGDPTKDRIRYGAFSHITCVLWKQFIRELQKEGANPAEIIRRYGVDVGEA